jgi:hypothetical protein
MKQPTEQDLEITEDTIRYIIWYMEKYEPQATAYIDAAEYFLDGIPTLEDMEEI